MSAFISISHTCGIIDDTDCVECLNMWAVLCCDMNS